MNNDPFLFNIFMRCKERGKFIYEVMPEMFGPSLTLAELEYWRVFNALYSALHLDIPIDVVSVSELEKKIERKILARKESFNHASSSR